MTRFQAFMWTLCVPVAALLFLSVPVVHAGQKKGETKMTISTGKLVALEYTLRVDPQSVLDSNVGKDPLTYIQGSQQIVPGLEKALEGLVAGDKNQVTVLPADAYGDVNPQAFQEVDKKNVPSDSLKIGTQLQGKTPDGQSVYPRVTEIKEETVVLDFNHPLAGKTLYFDVKVLDVKAGPAKK